MSGAMDPHVAFLAGFSMSGEGVWPVQPLPPVETAQPARVLAAARLALQVLDDLAQRSAVSLSAAEADLQACLHGSREDLAAIATRAQAELAALTVTELRLGGA